MILCKIELLNRIAYPKERWPERNAGRCLDL